MYSKSHWSQPRSGSAFLSSETDGLDIQSRDGDDDVASESQRGLCGVTISPHLCRKCVGHPSPVHYYLDLHWLVNMAPARTENEVSWPTDTNKLSAQYQGSPRNVEHISAIEWDQSLQPKDYEICGTDPDSKILFLDVNILDSTGAEPFKGDVLIKGEHLLRHIRVWNLYRVILRAPAPHQFNVLKQYCAPQGSCLEQDNALLLWAKYQILRY